MRGEAAAQARRGPHGSENADMSSERRVKIPSAGRPRVPGPRSSSLGESGPKARPTGVVEWMNGWIFPYRPWTGKTETVSTNLRLVVVPSFGLVSPRGVGSVAAVGQRRGDTEWEPAAEVVFRGQARSQSCRQIRMARMARCDDGSRYGSISGCPGRLR